MTHISKTQNSFTNFKTNQQIQRKWMTLSTRSDTEVIGPNEKLCTGTLLEM